MKNTSLKYQVLALAIMSAIASTASSAAKSNNPADENAPAVPGEFVVQFVPTATEADKTRALKKIKGEVAETILSKSERKDKDGRGDLMVIRYQPDFSPAAAKREIESDAAVEFVEPNYIYTHQATVSNDTYFNVLWGMQSVNSTPANDYGSQASAAWAAGKTDCSTVYVGIIDEGYMYTHTDLAANAGKNLGEIAGNKKDDDGNGYVDDVYGWDFDGNNSTVFDGVQDDHGTHVAGTIGAVGGNAKGVAGMCWQVKLLDAKFLGNLGGTLANAVKAVDYFTNLKTRIKNPLNIVATNNSWGGGGYSLALENAIGRANDAGILFVAAAGNSANNNDASASYPASYPNANVISVAAITSTGELASFSNYGHNSVDLGAPGSNIASTIPVKSGGKIIDGYAYYSGTSMATPHVTGACALYAATHPGVLASEIKKAIIDDATATPTPALADKTATGGRLNVSNF
jgi:subtilisin family serine protease